MSITDGLRKYAQDWRETPSLMDDLDAGDIDGLLGDIEHIADSIDAEYANLKRENESLRRELDRVLGEEHDYAPESHYMMLPKDADGAPVHMGDAMEWVRYRDDDPTIVRTVIGVGFEVFFAWSDEQGRYAQYEAHAYRHYTSDSWERIIADAAATRCDFDDLVARCKALAGDAE